MDLRFEIIKKSTGQFVKIAAIFNFMYLCTYIGKDALKLFTKMYKCRKWPLQCKSKIIVQKCKKCNEWFTPFKSAFSHPTVHGSG